MGRAGWGLLELTEYHYGNRWMAIEGGAPLLFTNNETNMERLFQTKSSTPYVKDAFHRYVVGAEKNCINPLAKGTKAAAHFVVEIAPGQSWTQKCRLTDYNPAKENTPAARLFGSEFDNIFELRKSEADEFYAKQDGAKLSDDARLVQRQAFAGLLWGKQSYHYDVERWLQSDPRSLRPIPAGAWGAITQLDASAEFRCDLHARY